MLFRSAAYSRYINRETGLKSSGDVFFGMHLGMLTEYYWIKYPLANCEEEKDNSTIVQRNLGRGEREASIRKSER